MKDNIYTPWDIIKLGLCFVVLPILGVIGLWKWIAWEVKHPVYFTYETASGEVGEAVDCQSLIMSCQLEDGTYKKVVEFTPKRR